MTDLPPLPTGHTIGSGIFNGQKLFTADQMRAYGAACAAAEREACAKLCDKESANHGGVVAGPMATERGKLVHEAMAAGSMGCAAAIRARGTK